MFETPGTIEPCFFEEHIPASLADLSVEIQREAANLGLACCRFRGHEEKIVTTNRRSDTRRKFTEEFKF